MIEKFKSIRLQKVKPATVNHEIAFLSHLFIQAVQWSKTPNNPMKQVKLFKEPPEKVVFFCKKTAKLLNECSGRLRSIVITALNTGMRAGEILNLKWQDITLETRSILVKNSKNNEARSIPINSIFLKENKSLKKRSNSDFVFVGREGKPLTTVRKGFQSAIKRAGRKNYRFHDLLPLP